jgi:hypothetical protein
MKFLTPSGILDSLVATAIWGILGIVAFSIRKKFKQERARISDLAANFEKSLAGSIHLPNAGIDVIMYFQATIQQMTLATQEQAFILLVQLILLLNTLPREGAPNPRYAPALVCAIFVCYSAYVTVVSSLDLEKLQSAFLRGFRSRVTEGMTTFVKAVVAAQAKTPSTPPPDNPEKKS